MTQSNNTATNPQNTSMPSLKIQTTVQVFDTVELDIELPYFCKSADSFMKIASEDSFVRVTNHGCTSIIVSDPKYSHNASEIASAVAISEEEFNEAYYKALATIDHIKTIAA